MHACSRLGLRTQGSWVTHEGFCAISPSKSAARRHAHSIEIRRMGLWGPGSKHGRVSMCVIDCLYYVGASLCQLAHGVLLCARLFVVLLSCLAPATAAMRSSQAFVGAAVV